MSERAHNVSGRASCRLLRRALAAWPSPVRLAIVRGLLLAVPLFSGCASGRMPMFDPAGARPFVARPVNRIPEPRPPHRHDLAGVQLTPLKVAAPVGCEVVMLAGVCGSDGYLQAGQKMEWMLSPGGVGEFVAVGRRGTFDWLTSFNSGPRKITNTYALGTTSSEYLCLNRGTPTPDDDIPVERGQAWATVTSPVEGVSYVTAYAPNVKAWDSHRQTAKIFWVDAEFAYPATSVNPVGTRHTLTTAVTRHSTHDPVEGWRVRYEITGGPPAGFAPDGAASIEVVTNSLGEASVEIVEREPTAGTNFIAIKVIRPASADGEEFAAGEGSTLATWSVPIVPATTAGPATGPVSPANIRVNVIAPRQAMVGQDVVFRANITNAGSSPATELVIVDRFDAGLEHASHPQERAIERDLGSLAPGQTRTVDVAFQVIQPGQPCNTIEIHRGAEMLASGKACVTALAAASAPAASPPSAARPKLSITKSGPQKQAKGTLATFEIAITNVGQAALTNLTVTEHAETPLDLTRATRAQEAKRTSAGDLYWEVDHLVPGQTIRFTVECQCLEATDKVCNRVTVTSQEGVNESAEWCLEITDASAGLAVSIADEGDPVSVGKQTAYHITAVNNGTAPEREIGVTVTVPENTSIVASGIKGPTVGNAVGKTVLFAPVASLLPGKKLEFTVPVKVDSAGSGSASVEVTSQGRDAPLTDQATTTFIK